MTSVVSIIAPCGDLLQHSPGWITELAAQREILQQLYADHGHIHNREQRNSANLQSQTLELNFHGTLRLEI
jgi:hypothetical protein